MRQKTLAGPIQRSKQFDHVVFDERGLVTVVVQDESSGAVLMVAWANREALELTLESGVAHFWSRARKELWRKGETSGNELRVRHVLRDCDGDTILLRVRPTGPSCHTGARDCFGATAPRLELGWLWEVLEERSRRGDAAKSYTARLLRQGINRVAQKVGEEAVETVVAALVGPQAGERSGGAGDGHFVEESADLLYHWLVLCMARGVDPVMVAKELEARHRAGTAAHSSSDEVSE